MYSDKLLGIPCSEGLDNFVLSGLMFLCNFIVLVLLMYGFVFQYIRCCKETSSYLRVLSFYQKTLFWCDTSLLTLFQND